MLGEVPAPPAGPRLAPVAAEQTAASYDAGSLPELVRRVVAPHLIADTGEASPRVADIDAAIVSTLRLLLHSPDFQRLEALWRGVDFLVRRLDTDERLQIHLIDIAPGELRLDLAGDRARSGLFRLLVEDGARTPGAAPWSLLVGCYMLGEDAGDVALLQELAGVARASGAPLVVGGHPSLAGCRSFAASPDPDDWTESEPDGWRVLRGSLDALGLAVVLPRFLLRLPYGERTDPCELLRFEEATGEGLLEHDCYLWGNGALAAALSLGDVLARGDASPHAKRIGSLPLHVVRAGGDVLAKPCSEVLLGDRDVERLLDRGVTPLMWVKDSDEVVIPRVQSIAAPLAPLAFERHASGAPKPVHG
jgi:type VI secretion system protein ImpC